METCAYCRKVLVIKAIMAMVNLKSRDIENELHLSKSRVSRHVERVERYIETQRLHFYQWHRLK